MSCTFYLIKGEKQIEIAHRHLGPNGLACVYNSELLKVNRSLDFLFLLLCKFTNEGWWIGGAYQSWNPKEFIDMCKECHNDYRDLEWHKDILIASDGTYWHNLTGVI